MDNVNEKITITIDQDGARTITESPFTGKTRIVIVINNQFSNAPNTTQIASGAGRSSAAGSNAAIDSSNTKQQQSVGAGGEAQNSGMSGTQTEPHEKHGQHEEDEIVVVINNQIVKRGRRGGTASAATQVASGGGTYSAGGTNAAIESSNTEQQHAVGGGESARAINEGMNGNQEEV